MCADKGSNPAILAACLSVRGRSQTQATRLPARLCVSLNKAACPLLHALASLCKGVCTRKTTAARHHAQRERARKHGQARAREQAGPDKDAAAEPREPIQAAARAGLSLLTSAVKPGAGGGGAGLRYAFRVVSPAGTLALQAASEAEQRAWVAALQARRPALLCPPPSPILWAAAGLGGGVAHTRAATLKHAQRCCQGRRVGLCGTGLANPWAPASLHSSPCAEEPGVTCLAGRGQQM